MDRTERFYKIEQLLISRRAAPISIGRIQVRSTTTNAGLAVLTKVAKYFSGLIRLAFSMIELLIDIPS